MEVYFKRSLDGGETWTNDTRLTHDDAVSISPRLGLYKDNLYVIWLDIRDGNYEVYLKKSLDGGETWSNDTRITFDEIDSYDATLVNQGDNLYLAWQNYYSGVGAEIFYIQSLSDLPLITSFTASNTIAYRSGYLNVYIDGMDNNYSNYQLGCFVTYKVYNSEDSGIILQADYKPEEGRWEAQIYFNNTVKKDMYEVTATLSNPDGLDDISVLYVYVYDKEGNGTPGFEAYLLLVVLVSISISIMVKRKRN